MSPPDERTDTETGRLEYLVVLVSTSLIAIHVVDDNFLQPEPGTGAAGHLVSGLVPLAAMALAVIAYPRLRPGTRAVTALCLGLFGIISSLEGWYYAVLVGPSGDDYSGIAATPAGLALLVVAAVTLWRSRRRDETRLRRYGRRTLIVLASLLVVIEVVAPILTAYALTHGAKTNVPPAALGATHEDVTLTTSDGLRLEGWYVPSRNRAAVIVFPGREHTQGIARFLAGHGYGVLLFDRRGEGHSEGEPHAWGWGGDRDVKAAISYLQDREDVDADRIGGIGLSVGGEMLLETAAETPALRAVVSEGAGIRSIREQMHVGGSDNWLVIPLRAVQTAAAAVFSNQLPPSDLADLVDDISPRPILLIYADTPRGGEQLNELYFENAGQPKTLWQVPGSTHAQGYAAKPDEYERRVVAFFDDALLG